MKFIKTNLFSIIFFLPILLFSQDDLTGLWVGYNTQEGVDFLDEQYQFEMFLRQEGNKVVGRSYSFNGKISAQMVLEGTWDGKDFHFQEIKIIHYKAEAGMEWCIKKGVLTLTTENGVQCLRGNWSGSTSFSNCIPGKVFLKKKKQRA